MKTTETDTRLTAEVAETVEGEERRRVRVKVQVRVQKGIKRINSLTFHLSFNIKHSAQRAAGVSGRGE